MVSEDEAVLGFPSALAWLVGMTIVIAILSEYVVGTIEVIFLVLKELCWHQILLYNMPLEADDYLRKGNIFP